MWWENPVSKSVWKINTKILHLHWGDFFSTTDRKKVRIQKSDYVNLNSYDLIYWFRNYYYRKLYSFIWQFNWTHSTWKPNHKPKHFQTSCSSNYLNCLSVVPESDVLVNHGLPAGNDLQANDNLMYREIGIEDLYQVVK